ncbi:MAG: hypothetical protein ABIL06_12120 [Pseudomonadota bacterium]
MDFELGKSYNQLQIGEQASFTKTTTETDVYLFSGISGVKSSRKGRRWLCRPLKALSHYLTKRII